MSHASLKPLSKKREMQIREFNRTADLNMDSLKEVFLNIELLKARYKELKETELTVQTVADLVSKMDALNAKVDIFMQNLGLNKQVQQKEMEILNKIDKVLNV